MSEPTVTYEDGLIIREWPEEPITPRELRRRKRLRAAYLREQARELALFDAHENGVRVGIATAHYRAKKQSRWERPKCKCEVCRLIPGVLASWDGSKKE